VISPQCLRDEVFAAAPGLVVSENLFDRVEDIIFCVKNRCRQYVAINHAFINRLHLQSKATVVGKTARDLFPDFQAAGYEQQDDHVFSTGEELHDALEMITHGDGTTGWYLTRKTPIHDVRRQIIGLAGISVDLRAPTKGDGSGTALTAAIETIQREYAKPLRIEDLARQAGLSLKQFERRMRAVLHVSPRQFLTKTRIEAAARALRETSASLSVIAADCGFYDQAMFCHQFRAATGFTPGQYRDAGKPIGLPKLAMPVLLNSSES